MKVVTIWSQFNFVSFLVSFNFISQLYVGEIEFTFMVHTYGVYFQRVVVAVLVDVAKQRHPAHLLFTAVRHRQLHLARLIDRGIDHLVNQGEGVRRTWFVPRLVRQSMTPGEDLLPILQTLLQTIQRPVVEHVKKKW